MLILDGQRFTSGRSRFLDQHPRFREPTAKVFVKVAFPGIKDTVMAQVDTGAAYSTLEPDVAEALGLFDLAGQRTRISTRLGTIAGQLIRIPLTLVADEGTSLDLDATFFVSPDWKGTTFLGYVGLLDRLRIALDSPTNLFYFGEGD
ncbi:MAG TPA: aspartyl protease family protein [Thermoanaerobaculia bacterium]|nr:aspartyl protease family protein [Thermoanaerobaculia bacterium]